MVLTETDSLAASGPLFTGTNALTGQALGYALLAQMTDQKLNAEELAVPFVSDGNDPLLPPGESLPQLLKSGLQEQEAVIASRRSILKLYTLIIVDRFALHVKVVTRHCVSSRLDTRASYRVTGRKRLAR